MKHFYTVLVALSLCSYASSSLAASVYRQKYYQLNMRDYDEMNNMLEREIAKSQKAFSENEDKGLDGEGVREATRIMREAMILVFSRPNTENMIAKLMSSLRRELSNYSAFEKAVDAMTAQAIATLKDKGSSPDDKGTAITILQNVMSEFKPGLASDSILLPTMKRISEANLDFDKKTISERRKNMYSTPDISKEAKAIVAAAEKVAPQNKTPPPPKPKDDDDDEMEP